MDIVEALKQVKEGQQQDEAAAAISSAAGANPDQYAADLALSKQTGIPVETVSNNKAAVEAEAKKLSPAQIAGLLQETPEARDWWKDHAKLVSDDFSVVGKWKKNFHDFSESIVDSAQTQKLIELNNKAMFGQLDDKEKIDLDVTDRMLGAQPERGTGGFLSQGVQYTGQNSVQIGRTVGAAGAGGIAGGTVGGILGLLGGPFSELTVATGIRYGVRLGSAGSAAYENFRQQSALVFNDLRKIRDEQGVALDPDIARGAAIVVGTVNAGLDLYGLGKIAETFPGFDKLQGQLTREGVKNAMQVPGMKEAFARIGKKFATGVLAEGSTEAAQQINQILGEEISKKIQGGEFEEKSLGQMVDEVAANFTGGAAVATVLGGVGSTASALNVARKPTPKLAPEQVQAHVQNINEQVRQDKLFQRSPEAFHNLLGSLTGDDRFYVDAQAALDAVDAMPKEQQEALFNAVPELKTELQNALASNSDVAMKKSDYARFIAPYPQADALVEHIKLAPEDMSVAERNTLQEYLASNPQLAAAAQKQIEVAPESAEIYDSLTKQFQKALRDAGRSNTEAKAIAPLFARKIARDAIALGLDPQAEANQMLLEFQTVDANGQPISRGSNIDVLLNDLANPQLDEARKPALQSFAQKLEAAGITPEQARTLGGREVFNRLYPAPQQVQVGDQTLSLPNVQVGATPEGGFNLTLTPPDQNRDVIASYLDKEETLNQAAYHGSPYKFDKFTLDHISKGEGHQAYGWGLYFAGKKEVAEYYRQALAGESKQFILDGETIDFNKLGLLEQMAFRAVSQPELYGKTLDNLEEQGVAPEKIAEVSKLIDEYKGRAEYRETPNGQVYEVQIPDDDELLHWDKPLSQQPVSVRSALEALGMKVDGKALAAFDDALLKALTTDEEVKLPEQPRDISGEDIYSAMTKDSARNRSILEKKFGEEAYGRADKLASLRLNEAGIKGIKYLDGGSRSLGNGTYNYVIFDDSAVNILNTLYQPDRGSISFFGGRGNIQNALRNVVISFSRNANFSTGAHEFAHFAVALHRKYAEMAYQQILRGGTTNPELRRIVNDWEALKEEIGATSDVFTVEQEEKVARMFEGYLREGNPPSEKLRGVFARFREWLTLIYRDVKAAGIEVNPRVAEIFDRWLASEDEIAQVQQKNAPITELAAALNLGEDIQAKIFDYIQQAKIQAEDKIYREMTREKKKLQTKAYDEAFTAERVKVYSEFERKVSYQVVKYLKENGLKIYINPEANPEAVGIQPQQEAAPENSEPLTLSDLEAFRDEELEADSMREYAIEILLQKKPYQPRSLIQFFGSRGGLKDSGGELKAMGIDNKSRPGFINKNGLSFDDAREAAIEEGYLPEGADINAMLEALRSDISGNNVYSEADTTAVLENEVRQQAQEIADRLGIDIELERRRRAKYGAYASLFTDDISGENSVHADVVADLYGYETGAALIRELRSLGNIDRVVNRETRKNLQQKFPNMIEDGRIKSEALNAVLNDKTLLAIDTIVKEMGKAKGGVTRSGMKLFAEMLSQRQVARMKIGEVNYGYRYEVNRDKELREALKSARAGKTEDALLHLQNAMVSQMIYKKLEDAKELRARAKKLFDKVNAKDKELATKADIDLLGAARFILYKYGMGGEDFDYNAWIGNLTRLDPAMASDLVAAIDAMEAPRKPGRDLTVSEFRQVYNAVQNIYHAARGEREFQRGEEKLKIEKAVAEMVEAMNKHDRQAQLPNTQLVGMNKYRRRLLSVKSALRRVELWTEAMDGGKGALNKYLWQRINKAEDEYINARTPWLAGYRDLLKKYKDRLTMPGKIETSMIKTDSLGRQTPMLFNDRMEMIGFLLHTGNESNMSKLLGGYGIAPEQLPKALRELEQKGILTKRDWQLVQELWDYVEAMKSPAQHAHKQLFGYRFDEIEPQPINTSYGAFRGGYWPAIADTDQLTNSKEIDEIIEDTKRYMHATVNKGMLKSRVEQYKAPLKTDLRLGSQHIDKMLRFIHLEPAVREVSKLINNRDFRENLSAIDPEAYTGMLIPWLQRVAAQSMEPNNIAGDKSAQLGRRMLNFLRSSATRQFIHYNPVVALQNIANMPVAAHQVGYRNLAKAFVETTLSPATTIREINNLSPMMEDRFAIEGLKISQEINQIADRKGKFSKGRDFMVRHGPIFMRSLDMYLSAVVWKAAYNESIADGKTDQQAIEAADSVVRKTMSSRGSKDVAKIEATHPAVQLLMPFYGYFNSQLNLQQTEFGNIMRQHGWKGTPRMFMAYFSLLLAPAVLGQFIVDGLRNKLPDDDDKDGEALDDWLAWFLGSQVQYLGAEVPIAGQGINAAVRAFNNNPMDDRLSISPAASLIETGIRGGQNIVKAARGKDVDDSRMVQDMLMTLGFVSGVPLGQFGKPAGYIANVNERDEKKPSNVFDIGRGLVAGPSPKKY